MASERKTTTNQRGETKKQKQNDNNRKTSKPQKARPFNQSAVADRIQVREKQRPNRNLRNHRTSISIDDVEILPTKRKTQPVIDRIIETTRIAPAIDCHRWLLIRFFFVESTRDSLTTCNVIRLEPITSSQSCIEVHRVRRHCQLVR